MSQSQEDEQTGLLRLLTAPLDLGRSGARVWAAAGESHGTAEHRRRFADYVSELEEARTEAMTWWNGKISVLEGRLGDHAQAVRIVEQSNAGGPACHPRVIAVIRKHWFGCDALNRQAPVHQRVPPWVFLLSWLQDRGRPELVEFLSRLPYWPIGLDWEGNWV